jgi:hypothetical protein
MARLTQGEGHHSRACCGSGLVPSSPLNRKATLALELPQTVPCAGGCGFYGNAREAPPGGMAAWYIIQLQPVHSTRVAAGRSGTMGLCSQCFLNIQANLTAVSGTFGPLPPQPPLPL